MLMQIFKSTIFLFAAMTAMFTACANRDNYIVITGYAQGGTYSVKLNLRGSEGMVKKSPEAIRDGIDSILNVIDTTLSGYNKGSVLSRFNAGGSITANEMFREMYAKARGYYEETGGALDVASGPLFNIWGFGFTTDSLPPANVIAATLASCGMKRLKSCIPDGLFSGADLLLEPGMHPALNFNAIAQGYSCDKVACYLHGLGVKDMLVDIGEIYCDGVNPAGKPWKIGIDRPVDGNNSPGADLDGVWESSGKACGIVTSGNYRKYYVKDGRKYAHTIDPRTGWPVSHNLLSATIVAPNATDADAYATYCMVIGLDEAKKFIKGNAGRIEGYLIYSDENGEMKEWASDGFRMER
ncbi:MAG: FAD:protein FMN transferase [Candidatus Cryptobacteroides sp.]